MLFNEFIGKIITEILPNLSEFLTFIKTQWNQTKTIDEQVIGGLITLVLIKFGQIREVLLT